MTADAESLLPFLQVRPAYSGLTDEKIHRIGAHFRKITVGRYGPVRAVASEVVTEVSFDSIQKSNRHKSGYALRFPRIVHLRPDKAPADADTLQRVAELYEQIAGGPTKAMPGRILRRLRRLRTSDG